MCVLMACPKHLCARNGQVFVQVTAHEVYQFCSLLVFGFSVKIMMAGNVCFLSSGIVKNLYYSFLGVR